MLVAGVGVAVLALAGCAPTSINGSAAPAGTQQSAGTQQQSGQANTVTSVTQLGAAVQHTTSEHDTVHLRMTMNVPGAGNISASGDMKFGNPAAQHLSMSIPQTGAMEMILVGGDYYIKMPDMSAVTGSTKPWLQISLGGGSNPLAQSLGQSASLAGQADPTKLVQQIASAGTITSVTHETVSGVPATHYSINVDVAKLAGTIKDPTQQQALSELGAHSMPFDIWVDSANLPLKINSRLAYANPLSGSAQEVTMSAVYSKWGQPVNITAPPADQVTTLGGN